MQQYFPPPNQKKAKTWQERERHETR
jgi:hypothetical protein